MSFRSPRASRDERSRSRSPRRDGDEKNAANAKANPDGCENAAEQAPWEAPALPGDEEDVDMPPPPAEKEQQRQANAEGGGEAVPAIAVPFTKQHLLKLPVVPPFASAAAAATGTAAKPEPPAENPLLERSLKLKEFARKLPICEWKEQILDHLSKHDFLVVVAETGSGKTTQIPQFILDSNRFGNRIAITQPRRVAAISVAKRVAEERAVVLGKEVGYTIRFDDHTNANETELRYMTDGCLLREFLSGGNYHSGKEGAAVGANDLENESLADAQSSIMGTTVSTIGGAVKIDHGGAQHDLGNYDVVILDEAHERTLSTDVLFAFVKRACLQRRKFYDRRKRGAKKLKVVVMSATLDREQFSTYFERAPVMKCAGRSFPIQVFYDQPVAQNKRVEAAVNCALNLHLREKRGHVLTFLTGMEECEQACTLALSKLQQLQDLEQENERTERNRNIGQTGPNNAPGGGKNQTAKAPTQMIADCLILPLYGSLSTEDQKRVFAEVDMKQIRKLIFSTNIAETSLTVDGIGYVVDTGVVKQKEFNPKTGMEQLVVVNVSRVQAIQRAGRAGRTQKGKCYRLYTEEMFRSRFQEATTPEILRSNLASVCLQMKAMRIQDILNFDFMERPSRFNILQALKQLFLLDAIDADGRITEDGREMADYPLEPTFARCLLAAEKICDCASDMVTLVSILSSESIWYRPPKANEEAFKRAGLAHASMSDFEAGDHWTLLEIYKKWEQVGHGSKDWCMENCLHFRSLRQAMDVRGQLEVQMIRQKEDARSRRASGGNAGGQLSLGLPTSAASSSAGVRPGGEEAQRAREAARAALRQSLAGAEPSVRVRRALCEGFYMQTCKLMANQAGWLTVGENLPVRPEAGAAVDERNLPEWLLYTELAGQAGTCGAVRNVSPVERSWLAHLLPRLERVDLARLVGESGSGGDGGPGNLRTGAGNNGQSSAQAEAEKTEARKNKAMSAKERFLARKQEEEAKKKSASAATASSGLAGKLFNNQVRKK